MATRNISLTEPLARLKASIQVGVDQLDRGEGEVVEDIDVWLNLIEAEIDAKA